MRAAHLLEQIKAVAVFQADVDEQNVVRLPRQAIHCFGDAAHGVDLNAVAAEPIGHGIENLAIVVDQQQRALKHDADSPPTEAALAARIVRCVTRARFNLSGPWRPALHVGAIGNDGMAGGEISP